MKRTCMMGLFLICMWSAQVFAGPSQRIEFQDGTVLQGEILTFDGSVYTIRTMSLGTVAIEASKVRAIHMGKSSPAGQREFQDIRQHLLTSPETLNMILGLQNDPDVQAVLQDGELMKAIQASDLERLISSPKFMKLVENPKIQEIGKRALK